MWHIGTARLSWGSNKHFQVSRENPRLFRWNEVLRENPQVQMLQLPTWQFPWCDIYLYIACSEYSMRGSQNLWDTIARLLPLLDDPQTFLMENGKTNKVTRKGWRTIFIWPALINPLLIRPYIWKNTNPLSLNLVLPLCLLYVGGSKDQTFTSGVYSIDMLLSHFRFRINVLIFTAEFSEILLCFSSLLKLSLLPFGILLLPFYLFRTCTPVIPSSSESICYPAPSIISRFLWHLFEFWAMLIFKEMKC